MSALTNPIALIQWNAVISQSPHQRWGQRIISFSFTDHPTWVCYAFLHDLATVMEGNITESGHLTILGNLNIKINDIYDSDSILLLDFLDSFDLPNKVTFPTHRQSNTIDLIISGLHSNHHSNFRQGRLFSDHHLLHFNLTTSTKVGQKKMISYYNFNNIDTTRFAYDVENNLDKCQPQINVTPRICLKIQQPPVVPLGWICTQAEEGDHSKQVNTMVQW